MNTKVFLLLGLVVIVSADKRPSLAYGAPQAQRFSSEEFEAPKYGFDWAVRDGESGNDFAQQETRDNDNTKGSYTVQLPDGRLQTVNYYVDGDSGFIADVQYQGEARYPDSSEVGRYSPPAAPSSRYGAP